MRESGEVIFVDFRNKVILEREEVELDPSTETFIQKVEGGILAHFHLGYICFIVSEIGHNLYLYGRTEVTKVEIDLVLEYLKKNDYQAKFKRDIDEDEGFVGDYVLEVSW